MVFSILTNPNYFIKSYAIEAEIGFSHHTGSSVTFSTTGSNFTGVDADKKAHHWIYAAIKNGGDFEARRTENVSTSHYFVRANNREFNFLTIQHS